MFPLPPSPSVPPSPLQFIEYSASKGSPDALLTLGNLFYWGARGMPRDYARAFHYFKRAADLGDPRVSGPPGHPRLGGGCTERES